MRLQLVLILLFISSITCAQQGTVVVKKNKYNIAFECWERNAAYPGGTSQFISDLETIKLGNISIEPRALLVITINANGIVEDANIFNTRNNSSLDSALQNKLLQALLKLNQWTPAIDCFTKSETQQNLSVVILIDKGSIQVVNKE